MQIRFRKYDEQSDSYVDIFYFDVADYGEMYKLLTQLISEDKATIEQVHESIFKSGDDIVVKDVRLVIPDSPSSEIIPFVSVEIESY